MTRIAAITILLALEANAAGMDLVHCTLLKEASSEAVAVFDDLPNPERVPTAHFEVLKEIAESGLQEKWTSLEDGVLYELPSGARFSKAPGPLHQLSVVVEGRAYRIVDAPPAVSHDPYRHDLEPTALVPTRTASTALALTDQNLGIMARLYRGMARARYGEVQSFTFDFYDLARQFKTPEKKEAKLQEFLREKQDILTLPDLRWLAAKWGVVRFIEDHPLLETVEARASLYVELIRSPAIDEVPVPAGVTPLTYAVTRWANAGPYYRFLGTKTYIERHRDELPASDLAWITLNGVGKDGYFTEVVPAVTGAIRHRGSGYSASSLLPVLRILIDSAKKTLREIYDEDRYDSAYSNWAIQKDRMNGSLYGTPENQRAWRRERDYWSSVTYRGAKLKGPREARRLIHDLFLDILTERSHELSFSELLDILRVVPAELGRQDKAILRYLELKHETLTPSQIRDLMRFLTKESYDAHFERYLGP